jgi:hypothetical protein
MRVTPDPDAVRQQVRRVIERTPTVDMHTHLYSAAFGELLLWGIDELLTYHYLVAELFRYRPDLGYDEFWARPKHVQAELIWDELFVRNTPVSEAARGVVTTLHLLGIDAREKSLANIRPAFARFSTAEYIDHVFERANVRSVVMTNDPLDERERTVWLGGGADDTRFRAALRLDGLLNDFPACVPRLSAQGFCVTPELDAHTMAAVREFLNAWIGRMQPVYLAVSLPPTFRLDDGGARSRLMLDCVLPVATQHSLPLALMIGVKKRVNPHLRDAGDALGKADINVVESLARDHPRVRFLVTMLSRENQHELCVAARKFANLTPFGCWWFLNTPDIIREITTARLDLLGLTMIPQHSDARVLDQLLYKWAHSRAVMADVLAQRYCDLMCAGWPVTEADMMRDARRILGGELLGL